MSCVHGIRRIRCGQVSELGRQFCDTGDECTQRVFCHGSKDNGEWLLDAVWFAANRHEIVLAVESEWGMPTDVQDDFDKLMSIKARRKLLIFNCSGQPQSAEVVKLLEASMRAYPFHLAGEEYMAVDMRGDESDRYSCVVTTDGRFESASFQRIEPPLKWPWSMIDSMPSSVSFRLSDLLLSRLALQAFG